MDVELKKVEETKPVFGDLLDKDEEEEALDTEIRVRAKHLDLDQLKEKKYPERLTAEWREKGGIWKVVALAIDIIKRFF